MPAKKKTKKIVSNGTHKTLVHNIYPLLLAISLGFNLIIIILFMWMK